MVVRSIRAMSPESRGRRTEVVLRSDGQAARGSRLVAC
jgi:hypothetical protein